MEYKILICDDDVDILNALEIYLRGEGYGVVRVENGADAIAGVAAARPHLVLLDIMMPITDGITAAVEIRKTSNVPIIFLSAKSEDTDRVLGLNMGGDDYITKPFNPVELLARIKSALRRYARLGGIQAHVGDAAFGVLQNIYQTGGLTVDDDKKMVTVDGEETTLTPIEYNILLLLIKNQDRVFSSDQIYEAVWNEPAFYVSKTVSVHIRNIREKIEINPKEPRYLKVVYGLGYKVVSLQ
ncbi:MAG: response regulator transcription factor [Defluviitaleaceae bacterium]|nr:response regulator transcription factor [Defluviitaleaceae bacterium]